MSKIKLYGIPISPFVRKVKLVLDFKNLDYELVLVMPNSPDQDPEFVQNSPLGKIPLLKVGDTFISDSDVIVDFLEREYPNKPVLPQSNTDIARALWFKTYASTNMVSVIAGHLFAEVLLAKNFFKREPIQSDIDLAINEEIPTIFSYLETELSADYLVGNTLTIADIAVCGIFTAMKHCKVECDPVKFPKTAAYIERVFSLPLFATNYQQEQSLFEKTFSN